jgi:hypothetical protein
VGERFSSPLERFASPRHGSHVAQLFSLGGITTTYEIIRYVFLHVGSDHATAGGLRSY